MGEVIDISAARERKRMRKRRQGCAEECGYALREVELGICTLTDCYVQDLTFNILGLEKKAHALVRKMGELYGILPGPDEEYEPFKHAHGVALALRQLIWDWQFVPLRGDLRQRHLLSIETRCSELRVELQPYLESKASAHR